MDTENQRLMKLFLKDLFKNSLYFLQLLLTLMAFTSHSIQKGKNIVVDNPKLFISRIIEANCLMEKQNSRRCCI